MPLTRDEIVFAYRIILGREPETEAVIRLHMERRDIDSLTSALLRSVEFRLSPRFKDFLTVRDTDSRSKAIRWPYESRANLHVTVLGNCQAGAVARLMQAMTGGIRAQSLELTPTVLQQVVDGRFDLSTLVDKADLVFIQPLEPLQKAMARNYPGLSSRLRLFPQIAYAAFHPDSIDVAIRDGGLLQGPLGYYHSSIAFWAWQAGWSAEEALTLYRDEVFERLGFYSMREVSDQVMRDYGQMAGLPMEPLLRRWHGYGCWMHTANHPSLRVLADLTAALLRREGIDPIEGAHSWLDDALALGVSWPVYPAVARRLGIAGSELFKFPRSSGTVEQPVLTLSLPAFVRASFTCYGAFPPGQLHSQRVDNPAYAALAALRPARRSPSTVAGLLTSLSSSIGRFWTRSDRYGAAAAEVQPSPPPNAVVPGRHPYADLPDHHFWRRMMEQTPSAEVDPVRRAGWQIARHDKVATAGSCFAQHISRTLSQQGFNYFVTETGDDLPSEERPARQFGVFSARYGNLYTARQLLQLIERAYGEFTPLDNAWQRPDGRWVDPFRPQVEPDGFATPDEVAAARDTHLAAVRTMVEQMDVFVFTLGLTECWQRHDDGAVYPLAPGVVAGHFDPAQHGFVNFRVAEVAADIRAAVRRLRAANPRARLIFTVSPVPLIATYEDRHVLVSTTESKAILRAAVGEVAAQDAGVDYFPSYEIITGHHARGAYFAADLRSVTDDGVAHVMRLFLRHYTGEADAPPPPVPVAAPDPALVAAQLEEQRRVAQVICDEEALDRNA